MMNRSPSHSVHVVKREEKETKLTQFVLSEIASGRVSLVGEWNVVALSMDSPVIAVLRRVIKELGGALDLNVRIVLTARAPHVIGEGVGAVRTLAVRASQNSQLLDAHEQLSIGRQSSWTGDCMRRNPRERDAFETFAGDNQQAADWTQKCFERFWVCSTPVGGGLFRTMSGGARLNDILAGEHGKPNGTVAATSRH